MAEQRAPLIPDGGMTRQQFLRLTGMSAAAIAAAGSPTLAHAAGRASAGPVRGGSIRLGNYSDISTFQPDIIGDNSTIWNALLIYDTLTRPTANGLSVEGSLAQSWDISPDGKTYTFHLRRGVKFHDGSPLTADDVKYSVEQAAFAKESFWGFLFGNFKGMEVVDPYTVRAHLSTTYAPFLSDVALYGTMIFPKRLAGKQLWQHPIGTGPFKFASWTKGKELVLARNPDFWRKNGQPYIDTLHNLVVPSATTRALQVQSGELDIALYPDFAIAKAQANNPAVVVHADPFMESHFLVLNNSLTNPPLNNKLVRQALNYAVNKEAIVQKVLFGYGQASGQALPPMFGYDPSIKPYPYDPAKAKALLKQAGFGSGFSCKLLVDAGNPADAQVATVIQQEWAQIGVTVNLQLIQSAALSAVTSGNPPFKFQMRTDGMSADIIDPDELVSVAMAGGAPLYGKASTYNNPQINSLLKQAAAALDPATRQKLYYQADRIYHDDAPFVFLYSISNVTMTSAKVQGFHSLPTGNYRMEEVWLQP